jgi:ribosomal protein L27
MALSANKPRTYEPTLEKHINELPSVASDITYVGSACSTNSSGYTGPLLTADSIFAGFAIEKCDNSAGSAGDKNVVVRQRGTVELTITGVDNVNDIQKTVYATDDGTFTLTASGATAIGKIVRVTDTTNGKALVYFESTALRSI